MAAGAWMSGIELQIKIRIARHIGVQMLPHKTPLALRGQALIIALAFGHGDANNQRMTAGTGHGAGMAFQSGKFVVKLNGL